MASKRPGPQSHARVIKASEFKARCLEILDHVQTRNLEVIVTKRGVPVAKVVPVTEVVGSPIGFMRGTVLDARDIVAADPESWDAPTPDPLDAPDAG